MHNRLSHPAKDGRSWLILSALITLLITLVIAIYLFNNYFPYRPTRTEAVEFILAQEGDSISSPDIPFVLYRTDIEVTHVISEVPNAQVVMSVFTRTKRESDGEVESERCYSMDYVTRHWLNGPRPYSAIGSCKSPRVDPLLRPLWMQGKYEKGTYIASGMIVDEDIKWVKAHWRDGLETTATVISDTFLLFRPDGVEAEWVVGLNSEGEVMTDTLFHNRDVQFTPLDYSAFQEVFVEGGIIVLGSYSLTGSSPQECVEVTYLTVENAEKFLRGQEAFVGQRACVSTPIQESIAPIVSTIVAGDKIISGRVLNPDVVSVRIGWADGSMQTVDVLKGNFFLARRPQPSGTTIRTVSISGLGANGEVITP